MEKKMENEMETGIIPYSSSEALGVIGVVPSWLRALWLYRFEP